MSSGSPVQSSNEPLTLGQLEGRLQLAMALREQLQREGQTYQYSARVAMESFGLELPDTMPLASFTQQPSRTNFEHFSELVEQKQISLRSELAERTAEEFRNTYKEIVDLISKDEPPYEPQWRELQTLASYLADFSPEEWTNRDSKDPWIQAALLRLDTMMSQWHEQMNLGQEVMSFDRLYQRAFVQHERVAKALGKRLDLSVDDTTILIDDALGFVRAARMDAHTEPERPWGVAELVANTLRFMETFTGPIPYKLQVDAPWQECPSTEGMEFAEIQLKLSIALAIRDYLIWTWRLEAARQLALDISIVACRTAGFLRQFSAA